jgi:hypothetical protein
VRVARAKQLTPPSGLGDAPVSADIFLARHRLNPSQGVLDASGCWLEYVAAMIRLGSRIRLTRWEVERFRRITDIEPVGIRTRSDLHAYVERCKAHYWGVSKDTRFLHWLIDREVERCLQAA